MISPQNALNLALMSLKVAPIDTSSHRQLKVTFASCFRDIADFVHQVTFSYATGHSYSGWNSGVFPSE